MACVDGALAPQEKLEAGKMLAVGAARREAAVPSVQCIIPVIVRDALLVCLLFD